MKLCKRTSAILVSSLFVFSSMTHAVLVSVTDLDSLSLGEKIVGPVGPEVEVSLVNSDGNSVGDLSSSVSCPAGFSVCAPPTNPVGTIYTYIHTVTPGVDNPNDAPFPQPPVLIDFDDVTGFSLGFEAVGFNGVAGYSFGEATSANVSFDIELTSLGEIIWQTTSADWDTGESISLFWQTTQAPSGPGGTFNINNADFTASGNGPIPTALPVPVPAPGSMALGLLGFGFLVMRLAKKNV